MTKGIVFINQATGYLTIDIVNEFTREFDDVVLITGSVRVQNTALHSKVRIEHITRYDRGDNLRKAFSWLKGTIQIFFLLKFRYDRYDKVYITVPPTAYLMAPWFKGRYSILIYDLYPEALIANGFSKQGFIYRWWAKRNRKIFHYSHRVYTLSEAMRSGIRSYAPAIDVIVIPNWSAFSSLLPVRKEENELLRREGLLGKFIVQYSGNIGVTHNVESLVDVAEHLKEEDGIVFQIIGRGERSNEIARRVREKGLSNCVLLPFRDDKELFESLCAADLAVIILDDRTPDISIPSKIYNIMSAGLPVMAIASAGSGLSDLIIGHNIGRVFERDNIKEMSCFIVDLKNNAHQRNLYSARSLQTAGRFTSENARIYLDHYIEQKSILVI